MGNFFNDILKPLSCRDDTKAYIIGIFSDFQKSIKNDLSKDSITLTFAKARFKNSFELYQKLGDWIFFSQVLFPEHLSGNASADYYISIGQISYYSCYRLLNKQWLLYEEMSDQFSSLEKKTKLLLRNLH
jgi:hypothetical protein